MNRNYVRGRNFEYKRAKFYRDEGYLVMRTAGSHGPFDLVAIKPGEPILLIQCKRCQGEKQAFMLIRKFKMDPPLPPWSYIQRMDVYVEDIKGVLSGQI